MTFTTSTVVTPGWLEPRRLIAVASPHRQSQNLTHIPGGNTATACFKPQSPPESEFATDSFGPRVNPARSLSLLRCASCWLRSGRSDSSQTIRSTLSSDACAVGRAMNRGGPILGGPRGGRRGGRVVALEIEHRYTLIDLPYIELTHTIRASNAVCSSSVSRKYSLAAWSTNTRCGRVRMALHPS